MGVDKRADNVKDCHSEPAKNLFTMAFKILRASQDDAEINAICPLPYFIRSAQMNTYAVYVEGKQFKGEGVLCGCKSEDVAVLVSTSRRVNAPTGFFAFLQHNPHKQ